MPFEYKNKKKLIIISSHFYDQIIFDKFDFDNYLRSHSIEIEFWKYKNNIIVNKIKKQEVQKIENDELKFISKKKIKKFKRISSFISLWKNLRKIKKDVYIFDINLLERNPAYPIIYKLFGAKLIFHALAQFPVVNYNIRDLKNVLLNKTFLKWPFFFLKSLMFINKKILRKLVKVKIDFFFYNGTFEKEKSKEISKKLISLHTSDYEKYFKQKDKQKKLIHDDKDYILFIDMGYPIPHDNNFSSQAPVTTDESYKKGILNLFKCVSEIYKDKKIIVALHPKSTRKSFYGYESHKGITNALIKDSLFVFSHDSLSLQLAVLWKKPIFILFNNDMKNTVTKFKQIRWFIDTLNLPSINIDNMDVNKMRLLMNKFLQARNLDNNYNYFIEKYVKDSEGDNKSISTTILDTIVSD
mgnify:FL=1